MAFLAVKALYLLPVLAMALDFGFRESLLFCPAWAKVYMRRPDLLEVLRLPPLVVTLLPTTGSAPAAAALPMAGDALAGEPFPPLPWAPVALPYLAFAS